MRAPSHPSIGAALALCSLLAAGVVGARFWRHAGASSGPPVVTTDGNALVRELAAREGARWDALRAKDRRAIDTLHAPDFVSVGYASAGLGLTSKRDLLTDVRRAEPGVYGLRDFHVAPAGLGAVVLTYRASGPFILRAATVWVRRGGRWEAVFHQATAE